MSSDAVEGPDDRDEAGSGDTADSDVGDADPNAGEATDGTVADLAAQVELLAAENRRLREQYVASHRAADRRTALGLLAVGAIAVGGGLALPDARTVLFALGGTGAFGAVLTYYLAPERFVAADTGERAYAATAATGAELAAELGLRDDRVYAPARPPDASFAPVRLFVPQRADYVVPDADDLDSLFVVGDSGRTRGVALPPTGGPLFREFEAAMTDEPADRPAELATQLADALAEGFDLLESAAADADPDGGRVAVEVAGSAFGAVDRFDHPVASLFGVGLADQLGVPVTVAVSSVEDGPADYVVACEWDAEAVE